MPVAAPAMATSPIVTVPPALTPPVPVTCRRTRVSVSAVQVEPANGVAGQVTGRAADPLTTTRARSRTKPGGSASEARYVVVAAPAMTLTGREGVVARVASATGPLRP